LRALVAATGKGKGGREAAFRIRGEVEPKRGRREKKGREVHQCGKKKNTTT